MFTLFAICYLLFAICHLFFVVCHCFAESAIIALVSIWHSGLVMSRAFGLSAK